MLRCQLESIPTQNNNNRNYDYLGGGKRVPNCRSASCRKIFSTRRQGKRGNSIRQAQSERKDRNWLWRYQFDTIYLTRPGR